MDTPRTILVVDDEAEIRRLVERYLTREGFRILHAADGSSMRKVLGREHVDLVILDVRMPGEDGLSLTRWVSQSHNCAIILLTSRAEVIDRVAGLESGADDYLVKPFDLRELLARINAVLRRLEKSAASGVQRADATIFHFDDWQFDTARRELCDRDGNPVSLSPSEFDLLHVLLLNPNRALSRDFLMKQCSGRGALPYDRRIDIRIGIIRRKIGQIAGEPAPIRTLRGIGYLFSSTVTRSSR